MTCTKLLQICRKQNRTQEYTSSTTSVELPFNSLMLSILASLSSVSINEKYCLPTLLHPTAGYQSTSFDTISAGCWTQDPASFILLYITFDETVGNVSYSCWFVSFCFH